MRQRGYIKEEKGTNSMAQGFFPYIS